MTTSKHPSFAVTFDYLCPFARNVHEHLVTALKAGAEFDVTFQAFSLMQSHVEEGGTPVWEEAVKPRGVLALEAGIVVREKFPEKFLDTHRALFAARHDHQGELADPEVVKAALKGAGVDPDLVFKEIEEGWPLETLRREHEEGVQKHQIFGVPTFVIGDKAVFVRLMDRPGDDSVRATHAISSVLSLITDEPNLNEYKFTTIPR
jgi:predicted DsbA family dithiol-disulfide isomerase